MTVNRGQIFYDVRFDILFIIAVKHTYGFWVYIEGLLSVYYFGEDIEECCVYIGEL